MCAIGAHFSSFGHDGEGAALSFIRVQLITRGKLTMSSFERISWFYQRLKQKRHPSRRRYMAFFEVSESTFKRDIAFMRDRMGAPLEFDRAANGYVLTDDAYEIPSFWFKRMQLLLMIGICKQLQKVDGLTDGGALDDFSEKLRELLTLHDGSDITECFSFEYVEWAACNSRHIDVLMDAILQKCCIRLTYHAAGTGQTTSRTVEPYRLHNYMGTWYLVGFCRRHSQPRVFQVGRITDIELTSTGFDTLQFDPDTFLESSFGIFKGSAPFTVKLRFDAFISRFIRNEFWHDRQEISENPDGGLTMRLPVSDLTEIKMKVLKYGRHVEVLSPEDLREQVAAEAGEIVKMYQE